MLQFLQRGRRRSCRAWRGGGSRLIVMLDFEQG